MYRHSFFTVLLYVMIQNWQAPNERGQTKSRTKDRVHSKSLTAYTWARVQLKAMYFRPQTHEYRTTFVLGYRLQRPYALVVTLYSNYLPHSSRKRGKWNRTVL